MSKKDAYFLQVVNYTEKGKRKVLKTVKLSKTTKGINNEEEAVHLLAQLYGEDNTKEEFESCFCAVVEAIEPETGRTLISEQITFFDDDVEEEENRLLN